MLKQEKLEITNWINFYKNVVNATNNKDSAINRWYPVLEGFSNHFVQSILEEQDKEIRCCLDPFAGGGTTPLVLQQKGIKCYSIEVSPFMGQVIRAKLRSDYDPYEFKYIIYNIEKFLSKKVNHDFNIKLKTIYNKERGKWLFHPTALDSILSIRKAIDEISTEKYQDLLYVTLGSIVLEFSNVFRDGKALKYKKNWKVRRPKRKSIYKKFFNKCKEEILPDLEIQKNKSFTSNLDFFYLGDCRKYVDYLKSEELDLVITSPPYLNSRDYTDSHMVELWILGHVKNYSDVRNLRKKTIRSHVQVSWGKYTLPNSKILKKSFYKIMEFKSKFWNKNIPGMIAGYFCDMETLLSKLKNKLKSDAKIYINVANSAYYGEVVETDRIIAEIASNLGYNIQDIRLARKIKCSSQQNKNIKWLRESIVVLKK